MARHRRQAATSAAARDNIGALVPGASRFVLTGGQFGLLEILLHALDCAGPSAVSIWTWMVAEYDIRALSDHPNVTSARLFIDIDSVKKFRNNIEFASLWRDRFGADSFRYVVSHAKMATIESMTHRLLIRGSANFNANQRTEQLDITDAGDDFALLCGIEDGIPVFPDSVSVPEVYKACRLGTSITTHEVPAFAGLKVWAK